MTPKFLNVDAVHRRSPTASNPSIAALYSSLALSKSPRLPRCHRGLHGRARSSVGSSKLGPDLEHTMAQPLGFVEVAEREQRNGEMAHAGGFSPLAPRARAAARSLHG